MVLLVLVEVFLVCLVMSTSVSAFNNGDASRNYNVYDPNNSLDDWFNSGHYGTHDWIAHAALDAILQDTAASEKWKDAQDNPFWIDRRKFIFFIGTEAPDTPSTPTTSKPDHWLKITLNGIEVGGWGSAAEKRFHKLAFRPNDPFWGRLRMKLDSDYVYTFASRVNRYEQRAMNYLEEGKCELAAFYMGAVVHYVSDIASFFHVQDFDEDVYDAASDKDVTQQRRHWSNCHGYYERGVLVSTDDPYDRDKVFSYSTSFTINSGRDSYTSAKLLAFSTRWHLYEDEIDIRDPDTPPAWTPGSNNTDVLWDYYKVHSSSVVDNWASWFKTRTQTLLQDAIRASADAINYMADAWALGDKACEECNKEDQEAATNEDYLRKLAGASLGIFLFIGIAGYSIVEILMPIMLVATTPRETPFPIAT